MPDEIVLSASEPDFFPLVVVTVLRVKYFELMHGTVFGTHVIDGWLAGKHSADVMELHDVALVTNC